MSSPFAPVLGPALALPLRAQFLREAAVLTGELDVVWHRPRWIRRRPAWARRFGFARERRFDAVMSWRADEESVIERTRPFELRWDVLPREPAAIEIRTVGGALVVLGRRLRLPAWLLPDVVATEHVVGPDRIHVVLTVTQHPLGPIFGYSGSFDGPLGCVMAVGLGRLAPWYLLIVLTNDVVWWPAFARSLRETR